jgi:hypothetical protein
VKFSQFDVMEYNYMEISPGSKKCVPVLPTTGLKEAFVHHNGNEMLFFPGGELYNISKIPFH